VEYAEPTVPFGNAVVPTVSVPAGFTTSDSAFDAVADVLSVTRTVKFAVTAVVGVPVIAPVDALRVRPAGNEPEVIDHE
jgi:hypothetical protein